MQELNQPLTQVEQQVAMLVTFNVKPEMSNIFKQALLNDITFARQESGYISMNVFAAQGHLNQAQTQLEALAILHAVRSPLEP